MTCIWIDYVPKVGLAVGSETLKVHKTINELEPVEFNIN